jgi:GntR family transcriptional regulator
VAQYSEWKNLLKIDHDQKVSLYYQIVQNIMALYQKGFLKPGLMLPSEWELTEIYSVSRLTVRQALKELESEGYIKRKPGIGTFFSAPTSTNIYPSRLGFTQKILNLGKTPSSKLISLARIAGTTEINQKLDLPEGNQVIEIIRVRYADEEPIMVETAYLSAQSFPDLSEDSLGGQSLYGYLAESHNILISSVEQELHPVLLSKQQADWLHSETGAPAMHSEVVAFSKELQPIEFSISIISGEKCRFYFHFREEGN